MTQVLALVDTSEISFVAGPPGPPGEPGLQGEPGPPGEPGVVNGVPIDMAGNVLSGALAPSGSASGVLGAAHYGGIWITTGNVEIPQTAGFSCILVAGGAHTVTFNGMTSPAMAEGDVMSVVVTGALAIKAVLTTADNQVRFS